MLQLRRQRPRQGVHAFSAQQGHEIVVVEKAPHGIDDEDQPALRQVGLFDQQLLALRFLLIALDQRRRRNLAAAAGARRSGTSAFAELIALLDDAADRQDLITRERLLLVGLGERLLDLALGSARDLDRDIGRHHTALDGDEEAVLAMFQEIADGADVFRAEVDLGRNLGIAVAPGLQHADLAHQFERSRVSTSQVLDQAHDIAILFGRLDHDCWYFGFAQDDEGFQPSLTADEVIPRSVRPAADRDRFLQPEVRNAGHQLADPHDCGHLRGRVAFFAAIW